MRSLIVLCFLGLATLTYTFEIPEEGMPKGLIDGANDSPANKGSWTWEEIDGKKFKVYEHEDRIPHGFSKKVFIKKTRDHIIKYIRLKKCGCRVHTTRKTWVGPHKKLWYDEKHHHVHHHGHKDCNGHKHGHNHHGQHEHHHDY